MINPKQKVKKGRKSKIISIRKLVNMVKLFQDKVDEEIEAIDIYNHTITTKDSKKYFVNISTNKVSRSYPDPW